jgi:nitrite reductase/ring-hydroxylating ferredoxin subunit
MIQIHTGKYLNTLLLCLLSALFFITSSCKKETKQGVPFVAVDIRLYSSDPSFVGLNAVGGWTYVDGGNRGILIYRKTTSEFNAFDRSCTYNATAVNEQVSVEKANNVIATDAHCGSKFLMTDGSVSQGPAGLPLKAYQTSFDGTMLHIYN